jgi:hypothetical protein
VSHAPLGHRLAEAADAARAPWLLFVTAGTVPQPGWVDETARFIDEASLADRADKVAAAFRVVTPALGPSSPLREAIGLLADALGLVRRPTQGLLIAKPFYLRLGRHGAETREPETDLVRRLGRRRIVTLRSGAVRA